MERKLFLSEWTLELQLFPYNCECCCPDRHNFLCNAVICHRVDCSGQCRGSQFPLQRRHLSPCRLQWPGPRTTISYATQSLVPVSAAVTSATGHNLLCNVFTCHRVGCSDQCHGSQFAMQRIHLSPCRLQWPVPRTTISYATQSLVTVSAAVASAAGHNFLCNVVTYHRVGCSGQCPGSNIHWK